MYVQRESCLAFAVLSGEIVILHGTLSCNMNSE